MNLLNIAMLGVTHPHASGRLRSIQNHDGAAVVAGFDDDPVGSIFFDHFGIEQRSLESILSDRSINAVLIHSHSKEMAPLAIAAMEAGKSVLVEKPGGRTLADLEALAEAAERTGSICQVGFNFRPARSLQRGLELVQGGALGRVLGARIHGGCSSDEAATSHVNGEGELGGAYWVIGSHLVDLALMFFGKPEGIAALAPKFPGFQDSAFREDAASVTLAYPELLVSLDFNSWDALPWIESWSMSVYGSNGELHMDVLPSQITTRLVEGRSGLPAGSSVWQADEFPVPWAGKQTDFSPLLAEVINSEFFDAEVGAFINAVNGTPGQDMASAHDALTVARIVDATYRSSDASGTTIELH